MVKPTPPDTPTVAKPLPATVAAAHPPSAGLEEWRAGRVVFDDFVVRGELGRLVNQEGRKELANYLAKAYMNKAEAVDDLGDSLGAVAFYDRAIEIYERLVNQEGQEGRKEMAKHLAMTYRNKADVVRIMGDARGAVALCDEAIEIYKRLIEQEGRKELELYLAETYKNKAEAVRDQGDKVKAVELCERALSILERFIKDGDDRAEVKKSLEEARKLKEEILAGAVSEK